MLDIKNLRLALVGTGRPLLTLGLMAARRDLNLVGICPAEDTAILSSGLEKLTAYETRAQVSTLWLGCPVWHECADLVQNADLVIYDSDFCPKYQDDMTCQCIPDMSQAHVNEPSWQALWEYVNQPLTSQSDGGLLTWEQAAALVEPLFIQAEKGK